MDRQLSRKVNDFKPSSVAQRKMKGGYIARIYTRAAAAAAAAGGGVGTHTSRRYLSMHARARLGPLIALTERAFPPSSPRLFV